MKKSILSLVMIPLLAVTLIGCGSDDNGTDVESNDPAVSQTEEGTNVDDIEDGTNDEDTEEE